MRQSTIARRVKPSLSSGCSTWKVLTPFHSFCSSSIRGSKNTSKSFPGEVGPGISRHKAIWWVHTFPWWQVQRRYKNRPQTICWAKVAKWIKTICGDSHASPSAGWLISPVFFSHLVSCHSASAAVPWAAKIICNLGISGKCLKILWGTRLLSSYLDSLHFGHTSNFSQSPQNNT